MKKNIIKVAVCAVLLLAFKGDKKPLLIQDYKLVDVQRNGNGQIVKVRYEKIGEPYLMPDSALQTITHVIIND